MSPLAFPEEFRRRLKQGKYTDWAVNLSEETLLALLGVVGEYGYRANHVLKAEGQYLLPRYPRLPELEARMRLALETIARIVAGEEISPREVRARVQEVLRDVRAGYEPDDEGWDEPGGT